jgi:hypothetical protein
LAIDGTWRFRNALVRSQTPSIAMTNRQYKEVSMRMVFRTLAPVVVVTAAATLAACGAGHTGGGYVSNNPNIPQSSGQSRGMQQPTASRAGNASTGVVANNPQSAGTTGAAPPMAQRATGGHVSRAKAGQIATSRYGGTVKEIESDHYHGKAAWEVEIQNSNQGRIEVKVDKATGDILDVEKD